MKYILLFLMTIMLCSCASLEQATTQALYQTQSSVIASATRKVQNGVEKKIDKTIASVEQKAAEKRVQRKAERDSVPK